MTRAKDISKIVTDADLSGTLDVTGAVTTGGLSVDGSVSVNTSGAGVITAGSDTSYFGVYPSGTYPAQFYLSGENRTGLESVAVLGSKSFQVKNHILNKNIATFDGTTGDISFYEDTGTTAKLFWDASTERLGIGTTSPERALHVEGAGIIKNTSGEALFKLTAANTSNSILEFADTDDGNVGRVQYEHDNNAMLLYTNDTERMRINSAGSVSIGTSSSPNNAPLLIKCATDDNIRISQQTHASIQAVNDAASAFAELKLDGSNLLLNSQSSGNVGIGTSSPTYPLDVNGGTDNVVMRIASTDSDSLLVFEDNSTTDRVLLGAQGEDFLLRTDLGKFVFKANNNTIDAVTILNNGNVGIGTSSPSAKLDVSAGTNLNLGIEQLDFDNFSDEGIGITFSRTTSDSDLSAIGVTETSKLTIASREGLIFATGGAVSYSTTSEAMRINSSGNVMIGTTSDNGRRFSVVHPNNSYIQTLNNSHANSPFGMSIVYSSASPDNNDNQFLACTDSTTNRLLIFSDGDVDNHDNSYSGFSDLKLKEQIVDASSQWDDIKALTVRKFKFKTDVANGDSDSHWRLGVIAQELETAGMNGLVRESIDRDSDNNDLGTTTKSVKYSILYMKAVKALQEAITRIETLETAKTDLEARIVALETAN